ncbi:MAG: CarD family transcriptional regulator [Hyphomicrobium sp.]|nr:CarD family transcriptional regulator [Hyphomicrobium sp.]
MTQKKKTAVKAKTAKVVAQPKKSASGTSAPRTVASNARPVTAATRKPAAKAAPVKEAKKPAASKVAAPKTGTTTTTTKPAAAKPPQKAVVGKGAVPKPAAVKPAAPVKAAAAPTAPAKKPVVASQPRIEAAKAAQAFAAHRAQAAQATVQAAPPARAVPASVSKAPASSKITAPAQSQAPSAAAPASPKAIAEKAAAARQAQAVEKKPVNSRHGFKTNEFVVYPAHGVGRIIGIEEQEIAGMALELFVINFEKEKLTLRVPTGKLQSVGMRKLADDDIVKRAMEILKGRARIKRTMWSRRAQEYVAKINSGDLISIAEVVRDLYRSEAQPEQSYSERQLYEDALDRMAREIAAVEKLDDRGAVQRITDVLSKSAKGRRLAEDGNAGGEPEEVQAA